MLEWIIDNKQWLFSGIGVTILGVIYFLLRSVYHRKRNNPGRDISSGESSKIRIGEIPITRIMPNEIYEATRQQPPLQRQNGLDYYRGLRVEWDVSLYSATINPSDHSMISLFLIFKYGELQWVNVICDVDLAFNRELFIIPKDAMIKVNGVIDKVSDMGITLTNVSLSYPRTERSDIH